ncbi:MAG: hypothetical protein V7636_849 [Actinomycetota bacterium]
MTPFELDVSRLPNVLAVRTVAAGEAGAGEVHVLASPGRAVEAIAADVHSLAILSGLPLTAGDVHVVQLQRGEEDAEAETNGTAPEVDLRDAPPEPTPERRVELDGVMVVTAEGTSRIVATARLGEQVATGTAEVVPASSAIRRGVAEATLAALSELSGGDEIMAVDAAVVVPLPPSDVALVTIAVVTGIAEQTRVGAVLVGSAGANDAIARAVLDATNRRVLEWRTPSV